MPDALALDGVTAGYGRTVVLEDISLAVPEGAAVAVLGRNGMGKTTLLRTIAGQTTLHRGRICVRGNDVAPSAAWKRAALGLAYVPQEREIFGSLTLLENITVALRPGEWTVDRIFDLFPALASRVEHYGNQLSGGEQQMLSIARALALQPRILLLDEPFEGLAPNIVDHLSGVLQRLRRTGLSLVLVEQHARLALGITDEAVALVRGAIVVRGRSEAFLADPHPLDAALTVTARRT